MWNQTETFIHLAFGDKVADPPSPFDTDLSEVSQITNNLGVVFKVTMSYCIFFTFYDDLGASLEAHIVMTSSTFLKEATICFTFGPRSSYEPAHPPSVI